MRLPADIQPHSIIPLIDSREQTPWDLPALGTPQTVTLDTGDYSYLGGERELAIERKSLTDLLGCIGGERERFERELTRMLAYPTRALIIEASWPDLERGEWRSKVTAAAAVGSVLGWIGWGIPCILAGDRARAAKYAARLIYLTARRRWRECRALAAGIREFEAMAEEAAA